MDHRFLDNSKFALLAVNNALTDLPDTSFQLSDGTSILPGMPSTNHLSVWKEWLGSIRLERLDRAQLVILVEERSDLAWILNDVDQRLSLDLGLLFYMLHLNAGIEISTDDGADLLSGSTVNGIPEIRMVDHMPTFHRSKGHRGSPMTQQWLEDSLILRAGAAAIKEDVAQFRRVTYGLETLFKGLREEMGQDRLHQFVRSLEALVLPKQGETKKNFVHRCQPSPVRETVRASCCRRPMLCAVRPNTLTHGKEHCSRAIRWPSAKTIAGKGLDKSSVWLVMHTHDSCTTLNFASTSGQTTQLQRSGSCVTTKGASFGAPPLTSRQSPAIGNRT